MAVNPNFALQFNKALGRTSEPKKARASGTVIAVSADSDNKIKNATISTGGGLIGLPVPYGINVYTGMNVAIINDGTPSNAQWRLAGTTSLPGGIQGGSIINHDGNTFAMFDSIWVRNDGVIIVGGDIDIDGNPSGPRVESNQCGYFGFDQYDRQSLAIYAAACDGHFAGDVLLGPEEAARIEILPNDGTVSVTYNSEQILEFGPDGNFIRKPFTVGNPIGARINLGEIDNKATFVLRDSSGVAKMVARTSDTDSVYVHIGNPPPEDNSMWFDSADGRLNVNGHVTMQSMDVRGRASFAETGEFMIVDPDDPGRFGVITPRGQYAYTTDSLGVTHLIRVDAWGPLVLEDVLGSGNWRTWVGGSQVFGDPRYRHFRIERGATARAGFFNGETPAIYLDVTGKAVFGDPNEDNITIDTEGGIRFFNPPAGTTDGLGESTYEDHMISVWESAGDTLPVHRISAWRYESSPILHTLFVQAQPPAGERARTIISALGDSQAQLVLRAVGGYDTVNQQNPTITITGYNGEGAGLYTHSRIELDADLTYLKARTAATAPGGTIQTGHILHTNGTHDPGAGAGVYIYYNGYWVPVALAGDATGWEAVDSTDSGMTAGNVRFYTCDATGGKITINLPAATSKPRNWEYTFHKSDSSANAITIEPDGAATINGAPSYILTAQYQAVTLRRLGANWAVKSTA